MGKNELNVKEVSEMKDLLRSEKVERIDFDQLINLLGQCEQLYNNYLKISAGEELLRNDVVLRISGMEKAVAAVQRNKNAVTDAVMVVDSLDTMSDEELLKQFSRSRAKFQDTFPTSFGVVRSNRKTEKDLSVYK